jgi:hypothetical protein
MGLRRCIESMGERQCSCSSWLDPASEVLVCALGNASSFARLQEICREITNTGALDGGS